MNILHNSNLTKVMGSTMEGDAMSQARGRVGSMGDRPAQYMVGRPSSKVVHGETWQGHCLGAKEEFTDLIKLVAWNFLAGRPRGGHPTGHMALSAPTSARASPYFPYKCPHSLHDENKIRASSF
jgi:hypothetical protein